MALFSRPLALSSGFRLPHNAIAFASLGDKFLGFFSTFCGIIYNEFFSIALNYFSCDVSNPDKCTIPHFGFDQKWINSESLNFINSFKMKFSVIVGVIQMTLGIILKGLNEIFFKNYLNFFVEFIPQLIFFVLLFGYLVLQIYIKWATDWSSDTSQAPSLITLMINIVLKKGDTEGMPLWSGQEYPKQETINQLVLIICIIMIPIMLFIKPIILNKNRKKKNQNNLLNDINKDDTLLNNINNIEQNIVINEVQINDINDYNNELDSENPPQLSILYNKQMAMCFEKESRGKI